MKIKETLSLKLIFLCFFSCSPFFEDTFNSHQLTSTKGETIYINSIKWGVTDDHQFSIISLNKNRLKKRTDSIGAIKGLEPFIYSFNNDSLTLYFRDEVSYKITESFKTITVTYKALDRKNYRELAVEVGNNNFYYSVPLEKPVNYPSDMPKPK